MFPFPLFILWFHASSLLLSYIQSGTRCGRAHSICNQIFSVIRYLSFIFSVNYPLVNNPIITHLVNNTLFASCAFRRQKALPKKKVKVHRRRPSFLKLPVFNIRDHELFFSYTCLINTVSQIPGNIILTTQKAILCYCATTNNETLSDASWVFSAAFTAGVRKGLVLAAKAHINWIVFKQMQSGSIADNKGSEKKLLHGKLQDNSSL